MKWRDGTVYEGMWKRGVQQGYGVIIYPEGRMKAGYFVNNIMVQPLLGHRSSTVPNSARGDNLKSISVDVRPHN